MVHSKIGREPLVVGVLNSRGTCEVLVDARMQVLSVPVVVLGALQWGIV